STRPGERYVFRAWLRTSTTMGGVRLRVQWLTSDGQQVSITTGDQRSVASGEWVLFELGATAPATAAKFRFGVLTNNSVTAGSTMYCDDAVAYRVPNLFVPTATQILNLENVRQRTDSFRFELCDKDLKPIGELHPDFSQTPTIQNDTSSSSSRRLQNSKLFPDEEQDVNPLTDRVPNLFVPTATQILNLENVRQRTDSFRFELCDKDLKPIGELHPDFSQTPTIQNDTSSSSSRRLQNLKLFPDEEQDVNPLTDRV